MPVTVLERGLPPSLVVRWSLLQVLEVCLQGLLKEDELRCLMLHINIMHLLHNTEEWANEVLHRLMDSTLLWKAHLYGIMTEKKKTVGTPIVTMPSGVAKRNTHSACKTAIHIKSCFMSQTGKWKVVTKSTKVRPCPLQKSSDSCRRLYWTTMKWSRV
jgi:hypothetical protein